MFEKFGGRMQYRVSSNKIRGYYYRKVASSNTSGLEVDAGFFRLVIKGSFGPYVL